MSGLLYDSLGPEWLSKEDFFGKFLEPYSHLQTSRGCSLGLASPFTGLPGVFFIWYLLSHLNSETINGSILRHQHLLYTSLHQASSPDLPPGRGSTILHAICVILSTHLPLDCTSLGVRIELLFHWAEKESWEPGPVSHGCAWWSLAFGIAVIFLH